MFYIVSPKNIFNCDSYAIASCLANWEAEDKKTWAIVLDFQGNRITTHFARSVNLHQKPSAVKRFLRFFRI